MKHTVYLVVGCPGSGKSWVCDQLKDLFHYVHHDLFIGMTGDAYHNEILKTLEKATKPILIEAPFSISQTKDPLENKGIKVVPVFIQEFPITIQKRYYEREGKHIPTGHLTRQETYAKRAKEWNAFSGTSAQVFEHLKELAK